MAGKMGSNADMKRLLPLLLIACGATASPPRKPYTILPDDPPCSQPLPESDVRHMRAFRNYVEVWSITPLEHHFVALWRHVHAGIARFAVRRNPSTGEIDVRSEGSDEAQGAFEGPKLPPVPGALQPFVEEIRRRATREDIPSKTTSLEFGYIGEFRTVEVHETIPLDPDGSEPRMAVLDSATLNADAALSRVMPGSAGHRGKFYRGLCPRGICACEHGRWITSLSSTTTDGTLTLSRVSSDAAMQAQILEAARRIDAGAKDTPLAKVLANDPDTGLLAGNLKQRLSLDVTVVGRPKQPRDHNSSPTDLMIYLDARQSVFDTARATTSTNVDGVPITISASLRAASPPTDGRGEVKLDLLVRVEDGRGRASEHLYKRQHDALVDGGNVAFTRYEPSIGDMDKEDARHVLPGGAHTTNIEVFIGTLRPVW